MKRLLLVVCCCIALASSASGQSQVPAIGSAQAEGSHVFTQLGVYTVAISWSATATARYLLIFDSRTLPPDGATSTCSVMKANGCLRWCGYMPNSTNAKGIQTFDWTVHPLANMYGTVLAVSTGADCATLAVDGANDFFYAQVQ